MRTVERHAHPALNGSLLKELPPADVSELTVLLRPVLARLRTGEWRLLLMGPRNARERDEAATFQARLCDLVDALEGRR